MLRTTLLALTICMAAAALAQETYQVIPLRPDPPIAVDGDLGEWGQVPNPFTINAAEQVQVSPDKWRGVEDQSAVVRLAWRQEGLYLAADVLDQVVSQPERSARLWKGDHIELFIDATPDADTNRTSWGEGQFQIAFSPGNFRQTGDPLVDVKPEAYAYRPEGLDVAPCSIAARRTLQGYGLEALVPFEVLGIAAPRQGLALAMEVALSDCDSPEGAQEKYMTLGTAPWAHNRRRLIPALLGDAEGRAPAPARRSPIVDELQMGHNQTRDVAFTAPATPEGKEAYLSFKARINSAKPAGFCPCIHLKLNGQSIEGKRLTNRPAISTYRAGKTMTFITGEGRISLCYSPDFEAVNKDPHYGLVDCPKACEYELLVTDLLREGANALSLATREDPRGQWQFHFADVALLYKAPPPPEAARRPAPTGPIPVIEPKAEHPKLYELAQPSPSRLSVRVGDETYEVGSQFSAPDGRWHEDSCDLFTHERRVEEGAEAVTVYDTFTNRADQNLPLMQRHTCRLQGRLKKVWLGGVSPYTKTGTSSEPANPTTFGVTEAGGLGLMAMNDEFQVHVTNYCLDDTLGLADNLFVLRPGQSYTAEWVIVPTGTPDFWEFVNAARRVRDANFTLPWQFAFLSARETLTDEQIRQFAANKGAHIVCASINYPTYKGMYAHGTAFQQVDHSVYARHNDRVRELCPGVKTTVYYHCYLDVVDDGDKLFAGDRVLRPDGTQANYGKPQDRIFFPTLDNVFGPATARNVDLIFDRCKADGVYWDEMAYSAYQYHYGEPWDGCTGDIDPETMQLRSLKSSVTLLSLPFRMEQIRRIQARGPLTANGSPHTRSEARMNVQRFVETASISNCLRAVLYSPVALGDHISERTIEDAYKWMLAALDYGCLYNWYSEQVVATYPTLAGHMFPATPIELHEGYIICKERIVTNRSGLFGWGDASEREVHVYDETGREVPGFVAATVTRDGKVYTELRIAEGYSAAIVRK